MRGDKFEQVSPVIQVSGITKITPNFLFAFYESVRYRIFYSEKISHRQSFELSKYIKNTEETY